MSILLKIKAGVPQYEEWLARVADDNPTYEEWLARVADDNPTYSALRTARCGMRELAATSSRAGQIPGRRRRGA